MTPDLRTRAEQAKDIIEALGMFAALHGCATHPDRSMDIPTFIDELVERVTAAEQQYRELAQATSAQGLTDHQALVSLAIGHREDSERVDAFESAKEAAEQREQALRDLLTKVRGALGAHWTLRDEVDCTLERLR